MPLARGLSRARACSSDEVLPDLFVSLCIKLLRAVTCFHVLPQASQSTRRITLPPVHAVDEAGLGRRCLWLLRHMRCTHSRRHQGHQRPETAKRHHLKRLETAWRRWCRICRQDWLVAAAWLHVQHHRYCGDPALATGTEPCLGRQWTPLRRPRRRTQSAVHVHPTKEVGSKLGFRVRHFDRIAP
jgi:hypothetical protein